MCERECMCVSECVCKRERARARARAKERERESESERERERESESGCREQEERLSPSQRSPLSSEDTTLTCEAVPRRARISGS